MSHRATEQAKAVAATPLGMYVHVPFCASTCDFCAFYQTKPTAQGIKGFLRGVSQECELISWDRPVTTVFWGGGTPGLLAPSDLARLGEIIRRHTKGVPGEWTVEMAPASVTPERLRALQQAGVTRISMGVKFSAGVTRWPGSAAYVHADLSSLRLDSDRRVSERESRPDVCIARPD
jgi:oxygen-independent coproporphyrinogen-3 oxidase